MDSFPRSIAEGHHWKLFSTEHTNETYQAGYVVLTLGYSLEFQGRDAFVDELYLREPFRGQGVGGRVLMLVEDEARSLGVTALYLEVERRNGVAQTFYRKDGFADHDRYLMTKWLT